MISYKNSVLSLVGLALCASVMAPSSAFASANNPGVLTVGAQVGVLTAGTVGSATYSLSTTGVGNGTVTWSVTGLPAGVSASFAPGTTPASTGPWTSTLTLTTTVAAAANVGVAFPVQASGNGSLLQIALGNLIIAPAPLLPQTISPVSIPARTYGDVDFNPAYTASSGLPVTYTSATPSTCTVVGNLIHIVSAGTCTFNANQAGNGTYAPAPQVPTTITIAQRSITIVAVPNNKVYDGGASATFSGPAFTGLVFGETLNLTFTFTNKDVANNKQIVWSVGSGTGSLSNYTITNPFVDPTFIANITPAPLTVTATGINKVYDGFSTATVTFADNRLSVLDTFSVVGVSTFDNKNAGVGKPVSVTGITILGTGIGNYTLANLTTTTTANITKRDLNLIFLATGKVYNANTIIAPVVHTGDDRVAGDVIGVTPGAAAFSDKNAGPAKTVALAPATIFGTDSGNYTPITPTNLTAPITPAPLTLSFTAANKVYDGNFVAAVLTRTLSGVLGVDAVTVSGNLAKFVDKNVGNGKTVYAPTFDFTLGGVDALNYAITTVNNTTANITALPITVTAVASTKTYDGDTSSVGVPTFTALAGSDTFSPTQTYDNKNVAGSPTKPMTPAGLVVDGNFGANYAYTYVTTNAGTITPKPYTISFTAANKVYDATTAATILTRTLGGIIPADTLLVGLAGGTATFDTKNVGIGKTVTATGFTFNGIGANNYGPATINTTTADITARNLIITNVTVTPKVYDKTTTATADYSLFNWGGLLGLDAVALVTLGSTATYDNANAGTAKPVTVAGLTLAGADAGNYALTQPSLTGDITPRALVASVTGVDKEYDGTISATVTFSDNRLAGDVLTIAGTAQFADKHVGSAKVVTVTGPVTVTGTDAGNYTLTPIVPLTTATITARALTVTSTASNKVFDGNTTASIALANNALAGDVVTQTNASADFDTSAVGTGKLVTVLGITTAGADAGNYAPVNASATTTADITAVPVVSTSGSGGGGGSGGRSNLPPGRVLGVSTSGSFVFLVNMRIGSKVAPDVTELQKVLIAQGFLTIDSPTGVFGPKTKAAVIAYQKAHAIVPTGNVYALTRAALNTK